MPSDNSQSRQNPLQYWNHSRSVPGSQQKFVMENPHNVGVDCAILMNPQTWVASGHLGGFSDPLMDCKECHERFRADKIIEDFAEEKGIALESSVDGSECKVSGSDLISERFPDLADPKRNLLSGSSLDILKVHKNALRRLRS